MSEFLHFVQTVAPMVTGTIDKDTLYGVFAIAATIATSAAIVK